jgi:hypothetical protein
VSTGRIASISLIIASLIPIDHNFVVGASADALFLTAAAFLTTKGDTSK